MPTSAYINYGKYALRYDMITDTFSCCYASRGSFMTAGLEGACMHGEKRFDLGDYGKKSFRYEQEMECSVLAVRYEDGPEEQPELTLVFQASREGIRLQMDCRGDIDHRFGGEVFWGNDMERGTFAMCLDREGQDLRCALGPAASTIDNALFDRDTDCAIEFFGGAQVRLRFDWARKTYRFSVCTEGRDYLRGFSLRVRERVYEDRLPGKYAPVNKKNTFPLPPAGWMTWYAVQFEANEKNVLENAAWQAEHLKEYGADVVWVDWEWYHSDFSGRGRDADTFRPDLRRYPRGLGYVAEEIKKLGLTPALWVGFTNDPAQNGYIRENPDVVLTDKPSWCGRYFLDVSHPKYLSEFIPAAFRQVSEWGYRALKWDCIPITLLRLDEYHDGMYDPELTSEEALRRAVAAARSVVGEDCFMLSCSGESARSILFAADLFDAARVGGDIFQWPEFTDQCVARVMKFYPYHNVLFYNDPDNVILRPKFSTVDQAISRISFVSLPGLSITLGDDLPSLPEDRVELLRRALPTIDAHPMDACETSHSPRTALINLAIEKPYERWNVAGVFNLLEAGCDTELDLLSDLHLPEGVYLVYDFWNRSFLGEYTGRVPLRLRACASKVLCVRKKLGRPQLLSTSRHVTQGAVDIEDMQWDEGSATLRATSRVVKDDPYEVTMYVPKGMRPFYEDNATTVPEFTCIADTLWTFTLHPAETGLLSWSVRFTGKHPS